MYELIEKIALNNPAATALISPENNISYRELVQTANEVSNHLYSIPANTKILLLLPNCPELVYIYMAIVKTGLVAVPLSIKSKAYEIEYCLQQTKAEYIFTLSHYATEIDKINLETTSLKETLFIDQKPLFAMECKNARAAQLENTLAGIFFTSGSTGIPKGIMHSCASLLNLAQGAVACFDLNSNDRFFLSEVMTNASGFSHLFATLITGATVIFTDQPLDLNCLKTVLHSYHPTVLCIMGRLNYDVAYESNLNELDFKGVRANFTGGDKVTPALITDFENKTKVPIRLGYGMSELTCITINKSNNIQKIGSIGTKLPHVEIRLLDSNGCEVASGNSGEAWIKTKYMMLGYWNSPELTKETLIDGWLKTGDLISLDDNGYYWYQARIKNLIMYEGNNISPLEIENVLLKNPKVKEAIALGKPDAAVGELPVAFIKLQPNETVTENELIHFSEQYLEDYKVPTAIYFVNEWPLTKTNKINRLALKERLWPQKYNL